MTSNDDDDDEFSPEDAFNLFTPIYHPRSRDRLDAQPAAPPPEIYVYEDFEPGPDITIHDAFPLPRGVTLAGPPSVEGGGGPPPDLFDPPLIEISAVDRGREWIFGETEDTVVVPLVLSLIGLFAVLSNLVVLMALVGLRRMRSAGPNLMLANLAAADLAIVSAAVPTAVVSRLRGASTVSALACRFVHYVVFVGVYVSMYTLVVVCVFGFFAELLRGGRRPANGRRSSGYSRAGTDEGPPSPRPLSVCSAIVSSAVIWAAFGGSHLTFVVQADVSALAAFEEPLICAYGPADGGEESSRARTLWITFLACAFLLPLTIVCALSAAVLRLRRRGQHRQRQDYDPRGNHLRDEAASTGGVCSRDTETSQNFDNDGRCQRELTVLVMAATVVRTVCWIPLQIFVLADVFGPKPEMTQTESTGPETAAAGENAAAIVEAEAAYRRKWELFCVCVALAGSCTSLPVLRFASAECRDAFRLVLGRVCCRRAATGTGNGDGPTENRPGMAAARRIQLEPGPPCSPSLTAAMLRRQCSYQPENEFDTAGRPKHLSLSTAGGGRLSMPDVSETILSIISDSSNHINYA